MAPSDGTTASTSLRGRCAFAVLVPFAIAMATILSSTVMTSLSHDEAVESHRLEREALWDIPVMDTLRLWKRSMGTVGSGKLRMEVSYENDEVQYYNTTERYYTKVLENTTNVYDEENNVWLNFTKNYTVHGNWTRTVRNEVTIAGLGQPTDTAISPDGKFLYVVTGWFAATTTYGGTSSCSSVNDCTNQRGHITTFIRDPSDGSLFWSATLRLGTVNLQKMLMTIDGAFIYVIEYDDGFVYTLSRDSETGALTLEQEIEDCSGTAETCEDLGYSRYLTGATDFVMSYDQTSLYIASQTDRRIVAYQRNESTGLLTYLDSYQPASRFFTAITISRDDRHVYVGSITTSAKNANTGSIYMFTRDTSTGELSLLTVANDDAASYGWTDHALKNGVVDTISNPYENTARMRYPRAFVMDSSDDYMYVASYSNSKVIAFFRDVDTGILLYKTSAQNEEEVLNVADSSAFKYPISMVLSGDGGSLYVASDGNDNIAAIDIHIPTPFPTSYPTSWPSLDSYPQKDPLSYSDNLTCSVSACGVIWPDQVADRADSRFDSADVCGGSCFSTSGYCDLLDSRCAYNTEVYMGEDVNATVVEAETVTWTQAQDFCEAGGARLCTIDEIAFDETAGSGCWDEDDLLWSSTPCSTNPNTTMEGYYYAIASSARYPASEGVCLEGNSTGANATTTVVRTRCCAEVICGHSTPSPSHTRAPTNEEPTTQPSPSPSLVPSPLPTLEPTAYGYDLKLTFVEDFSNSFVLNQPNGLVVSPDWYSVYVVGTTSNTIVALRRNATTPNPTGAPTLPPTPLPTNLPTPAPTQLPTVIPTPLPTPLPTAQPTPVPSPLPTAQPTPLPTANPTPVPTTPEPSSVPTYLPTPVPTHDPTPLPTPRPTKVPLPLPTPKPTPLPSLEPSHVPTSRPSKVPTSLPTGDPTHVPTPPPTTPEPTVIPTPAPTAIPQYYIRPKDDSEWCWTLPKADTPSGFRNGLVPILARCVGSRNQKWSFDIKLKQIHPQNEYSWCLDSDFDKGVRRPLSIFRCGKTFSEKAARNHQQWDWSSGTLENVGTKRCAATGKLVYQGRYIQSWFCDDTNQDWDFIPVDSVSYIGSD